MAVPDLTVEKTATIYALCDSREADPVRCVRYVGFTTQALNQRLKQHYADARGGGRTHRARWMRSLARQGVPVVIVLLEVVPQRDRDAAEQWWIARYGFQQTGSRLCNHSSGGGGPLNPDAEARENMRRAAVARMAVPEARARLSAAGKAQWQNPEYRARAAAASQAKWTAEARARASVLARQRWLNKDAEDQARTVARMDTPRARALARQRALGRTTSSETRAKQSLAAIASWVAADARRALASREISARYSDAAYRARHAAAIKRAASTPEERARRSLVAQRVFGSLESRERSRRLGLAHKGVTRSTETRDKLSAILTGRGGEQSRRAVLTWPQVHEIRRRSADGVSRIQLAREFHVARTTVYDIVVKKTWVGA